MKTKEKPKPNELIKIEALKFFTEQGHDIYSVIQRLIRNIDCTVTRSAKKKQYIDLYNKYIKGNSQDIGTNTTSKTVKKQLPKDKHITFRLTTKKKLEIIKHCLENDLSCSDYIMSLVDKDLRK